MKAWLAAVVALGLVGCNPLPEVEKSPTGPDVDIEVLAMHSRPQRVSPPAPTAARPAPKVEAPKPRSRRRSRPKPKAKPKPKVEVPPDQVFTPRRPELDEPPIDIPADSPDVAGELAKEFKRRDRERKKRDEAE